jgi:hypothetical protein
MNPEFKKYLDMIMTMTLDCLMGGITPETYFKNMECSLPIMKKHLEEDK